MDEMSLLLDRNQRFRESIRSAIGRFRNGEDRDGLEDFLTGMDDLEGVIDLCRCYGKELVRISVMLPALRELLACEKNGDVVGLTDVLEFSVYPLSEEWSGGCDGK